MKKLTVGDQVRLKNGTGPTMLITWRGFASNNVICVWWDDSNTGDINRFRSQLIDRRVLQRWPAA